MLHEPQSDNTDVTSSGGLELLFANQRKHKISVPAKDLKGDPATVAYLIQWLCENLIKDPRKEMFLLDDTVYVMVYHEACWKLTISNQPTRYISTHQRR